MKHFVFYLTVLIPFFSFTGKSVSTNNINFLTFLNDTSNYVIFEPQKIDSRIFDSTHKSTSLSTIEIDSLNSMLSKIISNYNYVLKTRTNPKLTTKTEQIDLNNYKKQFLPSLNKAGEKIVYVYCICANEVPNLYNLHIDWKKDVFFPNSNNKCRFFLYLNLKTKEYYQFRIKGIA